MLNLIWSPIAPPGAPTSALVTAIRAKSNHGSQSAHDKAALLCSPQSRDQSERVHELPERRRQTHEWNVELHWCTWIIIIFLFTFFFLRLGKSRPERVREASRWTLSPSLARAHREGRYVTKSYTFKNKTKQYVQFCELKVASWGAVGACCCCWVLAPTALRQLSPPLAAERNGPNLPRLGPWLSVKPPEGSLSREHDISWQLRSRKRQKETRK